MNESREESFDDAVVQYGLAASRVVFGTAAAIGIPGNILVLFSILYSRDMRTISNIFIFNIAFADLCFLLGIPIMIIQSVKKEWIFGTVMCKLYLTGAGMNQFASATFMAVLSFDRFLAVCHAVRSSHWRNRRFAVVLVSIAWIIVLVEIIPLLKFSTVVVRPNADNSSVTRSCTLYWGDVDADKFDEFFRVSRRLFTVYSFLLGYLAPLTAVWFFYAKIIHRVWFRRTRSWNQRSRWRRATTKVTVMGLAIIISYTILYFPFWAFLLSLEMEAGWIQHRALRSLLSYFTYALTCIYAALNPFLYIFFTDTFIQKVFRRNNGFFGASMHLKTRPIESALYASVPVSDRRETMNEARRDVSA